MWAKRVLSSPFFNLVKSLSHGQPLPLMQYPMCAQLSAASLERVLVPKYEYTRSSRVLAGNAGGDKAALLPRISLSHYQ